MTDVTRILSAIEHGDPLAAELLLPVVYDELRKLAAQRLALEKPGQTLQATALVHEAYLRVVGGESPRRWDSRRHFYAAAEAIRRILIDQARHKNSAKGGGARRRVPLDDVAPAAPEGEPVEDLLALDDALRQLEAEDPVKAQLVKLRYFTGGVVGRNRPAARHLPRHRQALLANVLVTSYDGVPTPMIIDFGVAKALGQPLTEHTLHTAFAQMIGTPLYMSPEQAEYNQLGVDTRSDVYSLGVLLYELLSGATPFDRTRLQTAAHDEMRRILREEEPPRPSARLSAMGAVLTTASQLRRVDPRKLTQTLSGELDWIVLRAMEKDRARRYETASAFAADIDHYLKDEQVDACPPTAGYRLRKYVRKNRRLLGVLAGIGVVLVAATAFSAWQAVAANSARKKSATDAATAHEVNRFLQEDLLGKANLLGDGANGNPNLTVKEALDRAAAKIGERFQDQPLVEASIRSAIGEAYHSIFMRELAVSHLERAVALQQVHLGRQESETLASMQRLSNVYSWMGRHAEALALVEQIVTTRRVSLGPDHPDTLSSQASLANAYSMSANWAACVPLLEQVVAKRRIISGPTSLPTIEAMHQLAMALTNTDRLEEALAIYEQALTLLQLTLYPGSEMAIWLRLTFAYACQQAWKYDKAERLLHAAQEENRKTDDTFRRREAQANAAGWLARNFLLQKRYAEAEPLAREAVAYFEKYQPDTPRYFYWMSQLGAVLAGQAKYADAEPLLLRGYEGMKQRAVILVAAGPRQMAEAGERIVWFYETTHQTEKARMWRKKLESK